MIGKTRLIFSLITMILLSASATAQIFDPDRPMIMPFTICADSINEQMHENLNNPCHSVVTEMYGWVQIPVSYYQHNGKSMGIIITRSGTYSYHAFDARCPRCFYEEGVSGSKIHMYSRLSAICPVCKAEAMNLVNMGTSGMTRYNHEYRSPAHLNAYSVSVIKKGKITYLRIANNPNGANDQWRKLPENKFLLNVDIRE